MYERGGDSVEDIDNNIITGLFEHGSNTWDDGGGNCAYIDEGCLMIYFTVSLLFMEIYTTNKNIVVMLKIIDWFCLHTHFPYNLDWQHK